MKKTSVFSLVVILSLLLSACSVLQPAPTTLRGWADQRKFEIGAAVSIPALESDEPYRELLAREFNTVVPENVMKWDATEPQQGKFTFEDGDKLVEFAEQNKMRVRGHTLVWHQALPDWVAKGEWTKETLSEALRQHVSGVASHYKGKIYAWDVVNEAVGDSGEMRGSLWSNVIGPEYIEIAFRAADEADPDALLFYNDYGAEMISPKADAVYELVKDLKARGVPIDGVGMQMHTSLDDYVDQTSLQLNIKRIAALGLIVHITEMDVRIPDDFTPEQVQAQAKIYADVLRGCLAEPACQAVLVWGVNDKYSWIPQQYPGLGAGLLFDEAYQSKPAYQEWIKVLSEKEPPSD